MSKKNDQWPMIKKTDEQLLKDLYTISFYAYIPQN